MSDGGLPPIEADYGPECNSCEGERQQRCRDIVMETYAHLGRAKIAGEVLRQVKPDDKERGDRLQSKLGDTAVDGYRTLMQDNGCELGTMDMLSKLMV
jgi:hypothetical protein